MDKSFDNLFLHADGDSFFVSCEVSQHKEYKGLPVVVGEDRGIAVALSYEAKKLGVTRGMPVFQIQKQFPQVIILPHHFDLYKKISEEVYAILISYLAEVERYSIDECFMKVKQSDIVYAGSALKLVRMIRDEIKDSLGLTYSFGLARTKALAKTASKLDKPNGLVLLLNKEAEEIALQKTSIEDIWGIGRQTIPRLKAMGIKNAYDFIHQKGDYIEKYFSQPLFSLRQELSGQSVLNFDVAVDPRDQKSIQSTATFKPASIDRRIIFAELSDNVERACEHARRLNLTTNFVSFFIKNTDLIFYEGKSHLPFYTTDPGVILNTIEPGLDRLLKNGDLIRATGITLFNLRRNEDVPRDLFGQQDKLETKNIIEEVSDEIRTKFGQDSVKRASSLKGSSKQRGNSFPKVF